ncbi:histidine kinase-like ATPase, C-terminal domain-containing protein [Artemisia annua]|uniref:Histidine kinase-like ATPase, C-terminal domain-containing protein n=1 Tax=Artemisia annua TaxID=35608 RepID=A0A2U1PPD2_ARTAN|nr:histidine kinase-like ATPase, C-terminal domain-containing protein [Artemisia annua]
MKGSKIDLLMARKKKSGLTVVAATIAQFQAFSLFFLINERNASAGNCKAGEDAVQPSFYVRWKSWRGSPISIVVATMVCARCCFKGTYHIRGCCFAHVFKESMIPASESVSQMSTVNVGCPPVRNTTGQTVMTTAVPLVPIPASDKHQRPHTNTTKMVSQWDSSNVRNVRPRVHTGVSDTIPTATSSEINHNHGSGTNVSKRVSQQRSANVRNVPRRASVHLRYSRASVAELLDNSLDEVRTGATYVKVHVLNNEKDSRSKMFLIEDNGGGMTPDKMRECMSLGYSEKSKLANTIGQYGNGFKTRTMRLGADVLVFTRNRGQDFNRPT